MDFNIPPDVIKYRDEVKQFLQKEMKPHLNNWYREGAVPVEFHRKYAEQGYMGFEVKNGAYHEQSVLKHAFLMEEAAKLSPGVAVAILANLSLGIKGLVLFGTEAQKKKYLIPSLRGEKIGCAGNTENVAGSDAANIQSRAQKTDDGWLLTGTKSYVTNGLVSDYGLITAISDPDAPRSRRISMFIVDLNSEGIRRKKLNKQVWVPSDLTRIQMKDVFVPDENLIGSRGRGLSHILEIFMHSRVTISALTLGTAIGAFELGLKHARERKIFNKPVASYDSKAAEIADFYSKLQAARLMVWKACCTIDSGAEDFRLDASMAKYLAVKFGREVSTWAADLFGAASTIFEHPIHKFPLDIWASSLGEGTQDVQKLVIYREIMKDDFILF
ncbi:hypothetical protein GF337_06495 [candidate division KSB1 bacterium]|nr:hypothetical protein [candidate division KSB1 bacterium]